MIDNAAELEHEWSQIQPDFVDFHAARDMDGTWPMIVQARLPADLHPDLKKYAQGMMSLAGFLQEDFRILNILHNANPTMIDAQVRGSTQAARNLERDFKLTWASWWDNDLNPGRVLDSENYEGQIELGAHANWLRWCKKPNGEGTSGCPVYVEPTIIDAMWWAGPFDNPTKAYCKYTTSILDCGMKKDGMRPYYGADGKFAWSSEMLPPEAYKHNSGKTVEIIVRDAEDPLALCPLPGCYHRKRRISIYICPSGGKTSDYEEVESYDSPFEKCSFIIVGGNVKRTKRDPHRILRPSAWILIDLVLKYNNLFNSLLASFAKEMSNERLYENVGGSNPDTIAAVHGDEDSGQAGTTELPPVNPNSLMRTAGPVSMFPRHSVAELMTLLDKTEQQYMRYRPNPALTGQMALSEVSATGSALQTQGAGQMLSEDLVNWDTGHKRMFYETMHAIRYTGYFEPDEEQTRYVATVSGRENVKGNRGGMKAGDEVYLDAKKCAHPVSFSAETSKDTPADRRDREERARTGHKEGYLSERQVWDAYSIFDHEAHEEELFAEKVERFLNPLELRRVAALVAKRDAAATGMDFGEEQQVANLPLPGQEGVQTHNTLAANAARRNPPPIELPSTGNIGAGGSSGLAG